VWKSYKTRFPLAGHVSSGGLNQSAAMDRGRGLADFCSVSPASSASPHSLSQARGDAI
jgi:hypothetical protein